MFPTFSVTGVNPLWSHIFWVTVASYFVGYPSGTRLLTQHHWCFTLWWSNSATYGRPHRNINVRGCDRCHPHRLEFDHWKQKFRTTWILRGELMGKTSWGIQSAAKIVSSTIPWKNVAAEMWWNAATTDRISSKWSSRYFPLITNHIYI